MKATLSTYRQSPRKVRLIAGAIRGKNVAHAMKVLRFMTKRGALPLLRLLESALANAKNATNQSAEDLRVAAIRVDMGKTLKRSRPRARGHASRINKRTSHITIELGDELPIPKKK
ncbi:MAG: large subunit ribosomal protein L22 [Parcubacteria group bacterium Gr01-1014_48]|nr:MAG: large subunit ribosomal protein L22 [Parcubacteria group bacterium Greene0416_14]TSC72539.1 MAG: large subunit ribosomal protein L22 [Parcubacteria group bacterium Gr01-1014_48]TSD00593.1 MAG: large subunit ribosomal protein L22 [Parcubacteria group bacterium Greene1014_15]TSD08283.1 MAG: large subunit ribosomal protein L22 [Parcubacteria group bacterium Greene0714_4]